MIPVTAIIPTYNEEDCILNAIESVQFADEILVVDSYSTDETIKLAKSKGAKIIQREYHYSASQKNWAIPQAKHPWIILIDADEMVSEELKAEIHSILESEPKESGFFIYRKNYFLGREINYSGWQKDKVIRLFKRDECSYQDRHVHAEIVSSGRIGYLKHKIIHNTYKNIKHYLSKIERYAEWKSKDHEEKMDSLSAWHFMLRPPLRFFKHYLLKLGFLDGFPGLVIAALQSYEVFLRYINLLRARLEKEERENKLNDQSPNT